MVEPIISLSLLSSSPTKNSPVVMTTCRFRFFWALEVALPQRGIYEFRFTSESGPQHSIPRVRTMGKPTCLAAFTPFAPHLPLNLDFFFTCCLSGSLGLWDQRLLCSFVDTRLSERNGQLECIHRKVTRTGRV